eukprot:TRINITY_DN39274_c0_g1_i1.p1 TRINITY_DN39274_c0_g1~~TRINITY_DN39274_c0_g1_i1.p1  ORF type:complete len:564 (-),score=65.54 TRINITY_DN39274_c0_g1_i1:156-1847(-)
MAAMIRMVGFGFAVSLFITNVANVLGGRNLRGDNATIERRLLLDLAGKFTHSNGSSRIELMEKALDTMFKALPKDENGALTHDVVRYALHRLFVQRHSWYVRGLDSDNDNRENVASDNPEEGLNFDLKSVPVLPTLLQNSVEHYHVGVGLSQKEVAALAASIEDLAHQEAAYRLGIAYEALHWTKDTKLTASDVERVVDTYFTIYLLGHNFKDWSPATIVNRNATFMKSRRWTEFRPWVNAVFKNASNQLLPHQDGLKDWNDTVRIVEAIGDNFGQFNDIECRALKNELLTMEGRKPGRVRLSDFYNRSRVGVWDFNEKIDYLRTLGALDESNVSNPLVIVTNYVTSPPQCLRASSVYHVCCRNECEDLMLQLENAVGAPEIGPEALSKLVVSLTSDSVKSRDSLTDTLMQRLREIAMENGGRVPLHSRKFALWMHHAFPRECPFPHKEGTTAPLTPDEWIKSTGHTTIASSDEEMELHIRPDDTCSGLDALDTDDSGALPWINYDAPLLWAQSQDVVSDVSGESSTSWVVKAYFLFAAVVIAFLVQRRKNMDEKMDLGAKVF